MKHLDTLFKKVFGREKDTTVSFDEDALWESIVEDLGPKNSIAPQSGRFGGWIPLSIVIGVVLAGSIYLAVTSTYPDATSAVFSKDETSSIDKTSFENENLLADSRETKKLISESITDNVAANSIRNNLSDQGERLSAEPIGDNRVQSLSSRNEETSNSKDAAEIVSENLSNSSKTAFPRAEFNGKDTPTASSENLGSDNTYLVEIPSESSRSDSKNSSSETISGETSSDQINTSFSIAKSDDASQTSNEEISSMEKVDNTNEMTVGDIERDLVVKERSWAESSPLITKAEVSPIEKIFSEAFTSAQMFLPLIKLNESGFTPAHELQKKQENWKYTMSLFSGVNLTDVSFYGTPTEVQSSKNRTETSGLGTQLGLDFSAAYNNKWSITSGLAYTILHTIYKDESNLPFVEDQHVVDGIVLTQNSELLDEFSNLTSIERNIYRANVHNNYYQTISVPMLIGWQNKVGQASYGLRVGPQLSYRLWQSGRTLALDSEGIYGNFENAEDVILKPWNVDLAGEVWLAVPVTEKLNIHGGYHFQATQNTVFHNSDISARALNHQLRVGVDFEF